MITPKESIETYWAPFKSTHNYILCEPSGTDSFNVHTAWYQPLGEEVVNLYYDDPPRTQFYFLDLKDCKFYHDLLKYKEKDIFKMDPIGSFYKECRQFSENLRDQAEPEPSGFLSNISKLFQFEH